jgi:hypothetical protein
MPRRRRATISELRQAVECLPRATRVAMLEGLDAGPIIAGAYATADGVCPMLAAHRAGGRCSAAFFADAWDRFAFGDRRRRADPARRASARELRVLRAHLQASLLDDERADATLAGAARDHRRLIAQPASHPDDASHLGHASGPDDASHPGHASRPDDDGPSPRPGDPERSGELRGRIGWAWSRLFRRYDEYELALRDLRAAAACEPLPGERVRTRDPIT